MNCSIIKPLWGMWMERWQPDGHFIIPMVLWWTGNLGTGRQGLWAKPHEKGQWALGG